MQLARVIGSVISTHKDQSLIGDKLLVLQPVSPLRTEIGRPVVAVDSVGAGVGEEEFFVQGREASFPFLRDQGTTDANVVGIGDQWSHQSDTQEQ